MQQLQAMKIKLIQVLFKGPHTYQELYLRKRALKDLSLHKIFKKEIMKKRLIRLF
jgi:hypothetical protein